MKRYNISPDQEAFNLVWTNASLIPEHVLSQRPQYRYSDGTSDVIGGLMKPSAYDPRIEGYSVPYLYATRPGWYRRAFGNYSPDLLATIQEAYDQSVAAAQQTGAQAYQQELYKRLRDLARERRLRIPDAAGVTLAA